MSRCCERPCIDSRLPYALGISSTLTVFRQRPRLVPRVPRAAGPGRPRTARRVAETDRPLSVAALARAAAAIGVALDPLAQRHATARGARDSSPCA